MRQLRMQFWSFDVVFAVVVFSVAITIMAFEWYAINAQLSLAYSNSANLMQMQAQSVASALFGTGSPSDWESIVNTSSSSTWKGIGIGLGDGSGSYISQAKLAALASMAGTNYQATKQPLGVSYEYYIRIFNNQVNMTVGSNPSTHGALTVDSVTRSGRLGSQPVSINILIWTNTSFGVS